MAVIQAESPPRQKSVYARVRRVMGALAPLLVLVFLLLFWEVAARVIQSPFLPPLSRVLVYIKAQWLNGPPHNLYLSHVFLANAVPSLERLFAGWGLAVILGIAIGAALGLVKQLADFVTPAIEFLRSVPPPALLPIFLILFGATFSMRTLFIAFGSVWAILLNTNAGVRTVDSLLVDTGKVFAIGPMTRLFKIILPAAAPKIFAGLRLSLASALILMVVSELVATTDGIGFQLVQAQRSFAINSMWANLLLLAVLGSGLNAILELVENRVLAWHRGARARHD